MALASQSTRAVEVNRVSKNNYQSPRKKKRQRALVVLLVLAVLGVGGYYAYTQVSKRRSTQQNQAKNPPTNTTGTPTKAPSNTNVPVPVDTKGAPGAGGGAQTDKPKPDVLTMGNPKTQPPPSGTGVVDPLAKPTDAQKTPDAGTSPAGTTPSPAPATSTDDLPADAAQAIDRAKKAQAENKLVEARGLLNNVLASAKVKESEKDGVRSWLSEINQTLLFSPTVAAGDPLAETYKVAKGDNLEAIAKHRGLAVDKHLIARVNRMANPDILQLGQSLKLVHGPFHAVVHKTAFRLDLYAGTPIPPGSAGTPRADGSEEGWIFIKSFPVGLGENSGTPLGTFVIKPGSKLVNPPWTNPRTGEKFAANDPKNPIGEHWLGLRGVDDKTKTVSGYGLHGTIDPDSIGKEKSMGCIRMRADDIAVVWEMLMDEVSTVRIVQ